MRLILSFGIILVLTCTYALADWENEFTNNYNNKGIDTAVAEALEEGIAPVQIIRQGLIIKGLPTPELIKALFCSLVLPTIIYESASANSVKDSAVEKGYQLALAQCAAEMEEQFNIAPDTPFSRVPPGGDRRPAQASPWKFN